MTQTLALFLDAYRELNARKMFWAVLIISGIVVLAMGLAGVSAQGNLSIAWFETSMPLPISPATLYKILFTGLGIGIWLTWGAMILAIISTGSIFPDFIAGGSIDLYLSKPISRLRLFLTKYVAALLFVALQVAVFSLASFLIIGLRGGLWEPRIFLAAPIVVCVFSYLFAMTVLLGMLTRSAVASILLTIVFWLLLFGIDRAEAVMLLVNTGAQTRIEMAENECKVQQGQIEWMEKQPADSPDRRGLDAMKKRYADAKASLEHNRSSLLNTRTAHRILYDIKTFLPKTRETTELLDRNLLSAQEVPHGPRNGHRPPVDSGPIPTDPQTLEEFQQTMRSRSIGWILATSLGFEAVVLALAAWIFCRRDF